MVGPTPQLVPSVHTVKYFSEPSECCNTCKQSMKLTMSIFVKEYVVVASMTIVICK